MAIAAGGGRVDGVEGGQLVAAGLTLLQRSAPLVRALSGRRAGILLPTSPQFIVALAASEGRGAVLINPLAAPFEIAHQLRDAGVGAVFTTAALASRLDPSVPRVLLDDAPASARIVIGEVDREVDLGSHFGLDIEAEMDVAGSIEEAAVVYTSAMAGTPLGARLTHRNLLSNAYATIEAGQYVPDDHVLALLPFSHLFGLVVTGVAPLMAGARVTTMARFNPVQAAELLVTGDVTEVVGVPAVFGALLAALDRRDARPSSLRLCICGGAPLPVQLQDRWAEVTGVELRQGYGLTEAGPVCLFNRVGAPNRRGTLGVPFPGVHLSIREPIQYDATGAAQLTPSVPAERKVGDVGEICVRGTNVFAGYVGGAGQGLPLRDGWLHTGDLGRMHPDGMVTFEGFVKPMVTRNGFNVYPREIERAIAELPGIEHVEVSAQPNAARENDILVRVHGSPDEAAIRAWCEQRLSAYKQPTTIELV